MSKRKSDPADHVWFALISPKGRTYQVRGDPFMDDETKKALGTFLDIVYENELRKKGLKEDKRSYRLN